MKNILTFGALLLALLLLSSPQVVRSQQPTANGTVQGRFELHEFDFVGSTQTASTRTHGVFRIDTATGDTWTYVTGTGSDGKFVTTWVKITDLNR